MASPDPIFADPRLARVYDSFDAPRNDLDAYVAIVNELGACRVLDIGCGTGSLAVRLAARGIEVVDVRQAPDRPDREYVAIARARRPSLPAEVWCGVSGHQVT